MSKAFDQLIQTAQFLRNAAPPQFDQFRAAFEAYSAEVFSNLLQATVNLPQAQGQAQQCAKLLNLLREIK